MNIALPVLIVGGLGLFFGVILAVASIVMHVQDDGRVNQIACLLPGPTAGGRGYAGCKNYAEGIMKDGAPINLCAPGGPSVAKAIGELLGTSAGGVEPRFAVNLCQGTCDAAVKRFEYDGIQTCRAANGLYGGDAACPYGCLGLGDCVAVCKFNAIRVIDGVARIDVNACTNCGACVRECPKGLIRSVPAQTTAIVLCSSHSTGKETRAACKNGCIACGKCVKVCPVDAITMEDHLALIHPELCTGCGLCVEACPTGSIAMIPKAG